MMICCWVGWFMMLFVFKIFCIDGLLCVLDMLWFLMVCECIENFLVDIGVDYW